MNTIKIFDFTLINAGLKVKIIYPIWALDGQGKRATSNLTKTNKYLLFKEGNAFVKKSKNLATLRKIAKNYNRKTLIFDVLNFRILKC